MNDERTMFLHFVRGCLEEIINCQGDPDTLRQELDLAHQVFASISESEFREARAWVEGTAELKQRKRGKAARRKVAAVLAYQLSQSVGGRKPRDDREDALRRLRGAWVAVDTLLELGLSQIEACRLLVVGRCRCTKACRRVNFVRDWAEVEAACRQRLQALDRKED